MVEKKKKKVKENRRFSRFMIQDKASSLSLSLWNQDERNKLKRRKRGRKRGLRGLSLFFFPSFFKKSQEGGNRGNWNEQRSFSKYLLMIYFMRVWILFFTKRKRKKSKKALFPRCCESITVSFYIYKRGLSLYYSWKCGICFTFERCILVPLIPWLFTFFKDEISTPWRDEYFFLFFFIFFNFIKALVCLA